MIFGRSLHICARGTPKFADRLKHAHADGTHRPVSHCFTADTDTPTAAANSACVQCFACLPRLIISLTSNRNTSFHKSIIITFILYIPRLECFSSPIARQRVTGYAPHSPSRLHKQKYRYGRIKVGRKKPPNFSRSYAFIPLEI